MPKQTKKKNGFNSILSLKYGEPLIAITQPYCVHPSSLVSPTCALTQPYSDD